MIYISLPVHTQPVVVAGQIRNFAYFFPQAVVVLHVSASARFTMAQLTAALAAAGCNNAVINPQRAATDWGNILPAHLANIAYIRSRTNASQICLHSSNDMLVRHGVAARLRSGHNFYNRRFVTPGTFWRFGHAALVDPCLAALRARLDSSDVVGSQIEGSCYEADVMFEIADLIASMPPRPPPLRYPREEVWFSTLAHALRARCDGAPYVFSELHRFDRVFWRVLRHVNPVIGTGTASSDFIRRAIEYAMIKSGFHRINRTWVDRIANDLHTPLLPYEVMSDGNNCWRVFDRHGLYGVKRVPRKTTSALRRYIDALAAPHDAQLSPDRSA